jgi:hypothetical protein
MDLSRPDQQAVWAACERLMQIARLDTGQSRRVANFLLASHNAEKNGGWDAVDLRNIDDAIARRDAVILGMVRKSHSYPDDLGFADKIQAVWRTWYRPKVTI